MIVALCKCVLVKTVSQVTYVGNGPLVSCMWSTVLARFNTSAEYDRFVSFLYHNEEDTGDLKSYFSIFPSVPCILRGDRWSINGLMWNATPNFYIMDR